MLLLFISEHFFVYWIENEIKHKMHTNIILLVLCGCDIQPHRNGENVKEHRNGENVKEQSARIIW